MPRRNRAEERRARRREYFDARLEAAEGPIHRVSVAASALQAAIAGLPPHLGEQLADQAVDFLIERAQEVFSGG